MFSIKQIKTASCFIAFVLVAILGLATLGPQTVSAAIQATYYASPTGSGSTCSLAAPCSLTGVRDKVRTVNSAMTGDIHVILRGGTYPLSSTFELTESTTIHDSGTNGFNIIYQAYAGEVPVLSGGQTITGWTLYDSNKNIYRSNVGTTLDTRQLYVNGVRATRARGEMNPSGFTNATSSSTSPSTGLTAPATGTYANMSSWGNISNIEIHSISAWKSFRCGVSTISGSVITMDTPCWNNSQKQFGVHQNLPTWIENAYELLDSEGEWYLDRTGGYLYYKPLAGGNMTTDTIVAAKLETLVSGTGTLTTPLHNVQFYGITFSYSTWLRPNTTEGYVPVQAGFGLVGNNPGWDFSATSWVKSQPDVTFRAAKSIRFERNVFTHLGGFGLNFEYGSTDNVVIGNVFTDISGSAVQIGSNDDHHTTAAGTVKNNLIKNNYITKIGQEYFDGVGIWVGYTDSTVIEHNEVYDTPYTGISAGWGWGFNDVGGSSGYTTPTVAQNNTIRYNYVHKFMQTLNDGGGIYTLGAQPTSTVNNNYISGHPNIHGGGLYHDNGTRGFETFNNVVTSVPHASWLIVTPGYPDAEYNTVQYNYSDTSVTYCCGANNTIHNNAVVTNGIWPDAAQAIMNNAGIEQSYQDIKGYNENVAGTGQNQFNYTGTWIHENNSSASGGTLRYSNTTNDYVTFAFTGTQIKWRSDPGDNGGIAAVSIDGGAETMIDLYNAAAIRPWDTVAYTSPVLSSGTHTIKVRVTGTKNASSSASWIFIDGMEVIPGLMNSSNFNENVTGTGQNQFNYTGTWTNENNSSASGGTMRYSNTTNDYVTFAFTGTQVKWRSDPGYNGGIAAVSIDGDAETMIDLYSAAAIRPWDTVVYTSPVLSSGTHTIKIRVTGTKNASSSNSWIFIDGLEVMPALSMNENVTGTGQNQFNYTGTWTNENNSSASGGTMRYSNTTNDYVTFAFTGTRIVWRSDPGYNGGIAAVSIDGGAETMIDLYSPAAIRPWDTVVYTSPVLGSGTHSIKIRVTGTKNASSSASWIFIDGMQVAP